MENIKEKLAKIWALSSGWEAAGEIPDLERDMALDLLRRVYEELKFAGIRKSEPAAAPEPETASAPAAVSTQAPAKEPMPEVTGTVGIEPEADDDFVARVVFASEALVPESAPEPVAEPATEPATEPDNEYEPAETETVVWAEPEPEPVVDSEPEPEPEPESESEPEPVRRVPKPVAPEVIRSLYGTDDAPEPAEHFSAWLDSEPESTPSEPEPASRDIEPEPDEPAIGAPGVYVPKIEVYEPEPMPEVEPDLVTEPEPEAIEPEPVREPEHDEAWAEAIKTTMSAMQSDPQRAFSPLPEPTLAEAMAAGRRTLGESLRGNERDMASHLAAAERPGLRRSIGLNDRFLMIRDMFGGDAAAFDRAIARLDTFNNLDDAVIWIHDNFDWSADSAGAALLVDLLERKLGR